jgi:VanZ family protein
MHLPRSPLVWFAGFAVWFGVLWHLSSGPIPLRTGMQFPHFDKLAHFGYFFGGSGLLHAAIAFSGRCSPRTRHLLVLIVMASVGWLDEWHQAWVPERSGLDPWDWAADLLGALAGGSVFDRVLPRLRRPARA